MSDKPKTIDEKVAAIEKKITNIIAYVVAFSVVAGIFGYSQITDLSEIRSGEVVKKFKEELKTQKDSLGKELEKSTNSKVSKINEIRDDLNKQLPVGTIIISSVPYENIVSDVWAPCDGRIVPGSKYASNYSRPVPDLRGVFIRGLNRFDLEEDTPVPDNQKDPEGLRTVGALQHDSLKNHDHGFHQIRSQNYERKASKSHFTLGHPDSVTNGPYKENQLGSETRPKNVAVYYYIKIN